MRLSRRDTTNIGCDDLATCTASREGTPVRLYSTGHQVTLAAEIKEKCSRKVFFSPRAFDVATTSLIGLNVCAYGNIFSFSHMEILTVIFYFRPWPGTDYV